MWVTKKRWRGKWGHIAESEDLITQNTGEVLKVFFVSVFTSKIVLQESQVPETSKIIWSKEDVPLVEEDEVKEYLGTPDTQRFMGSDRIYRQMLTKKKCCWPSVWH